MVNKFIICEKPLFSSCSFPLEVQQGFYTIAVSALFTLALIYNSIDRCSAWRAGGAGLVIWRLVCF